jgi:hypothetical protein
LDAIAFSSLARKTMSHLIIHVESAENAAKFWLLPIELVWAVGYNSKEIRQVRELVEENASFFLEKWHEQPRNT